MPQYSDSDTLDLGALVLHREDMSGVIIDPIFRPMFDKTQTNSRVVITDEDIRNLPIPK